MLLSEHMAPHTVVPAPGIFSLNTYSELPNFFKCEYLEEGKISVHRSPRRGKGKY